MTLSRTLRPVFALLAGGMVASCGAVDGDMASFESMAQYVADIPVDGQPAPRSQSAPTTIAGLRPAFADSPTRPAALKVEVLDPHALWDARDGLRRPFAAAEQVIEPAVLRPAIAPEPAHPEATAPAAASRGPRTTIQLGAYSSGEAARAAWAETSAGRARAALNGLTPEFVTVQVKGKPLVRLRVSAPAATAAAICRAAEVSDPWCLRGA